MSVSERYIAVGNLHSECYLHYCHRIVSILCMCIWFELVVQTRVFGGLLCGPKHGFYLKVVSVIQ